MRVDHDLSADAAYIHITSDSDGPITSTVELSVPDGVTGLIIADFAESTLVGLEIVGVSHVAPGLVASPH